MRDRGPIEPLFAFNARLWLRVWAATQAVALAVACYTMLARDPGALTSSPGWVRALSIIIALIAYHVVGLMAHEWILRRRWAVGLFIPLGWLLVLASLRLAGPFGLLVLGAIIQGFIFLPFAWAIGTLSLATAILLAGIALNSARLGSNLIVAQVVGTLATAIMIGTVMLYIHRVNRDAAIRARLLQQLDAAQRDLAERAKEAGVQEERQRLARDIHDTLAQGFASVIRHLEAIELSFASTNGADEVKQAAAPHLAHAQTVSRSSLDEIRRLVYALRPPQLAESTLGAAIERIVAQWSEANGIASTCRIDALPPLGPDADVTILRATQEALSNVARHATAARVNVTLQTVDGVVLLSVEDDGRGMGDGEAGGSEHMGLAGMRERVRRFGGHVLIESSAGAGTSLTVALPLTAVRA